LIPSLSIKISLGKFNSKAEAEEMTWEATYEDRRVSLGIHSKGYS